MILTWTIKLDTEESDNKKISIMEIGDILTECEDAINKRGYALYDSEFERED